MKFKNKVKNKISLKWQLFGIFTAFAAIILAMLWLFQIVFLDDFYKEIKIRNIKEAAYNIEKNIDNPDLQTLVTRIAQSGEMCVLVYKTDGTRLADADLLIGCLLHKVSAQTREEWYLAAADSGGEYLNIYQLDTFKNNQYDSGNFQGKVPVADPGMYDSLIYIDIVTNGTGEEIVLMLNSAITPVTATVNTLTTLLLIITAITVLLALIIALLLSKALSKPISKLNDSAKILATGNYDVNFDASGFREINELSDTLSYAAGELSKVDEYRRELIANVSHDLRTPLTLITGYGEAIRDLPNENTSENIQIIVDESKRLTDLVNDMLDLSKYESGNITLNQTDFNLSNTIKKIVGRYSKFVKQDGYSIASEIDDNLFVTADELKISQAIYNLINNAISYTGKDKSILVKLKKIENSVRFEVIDTGEGIPAEKQGLIWNRYYKIDKTHKRAQIGSGLGLSIVKKIYELHGAKYGVSSTVGKGSCFWFELNQSTQQ